VASNKDLKNESRRRADGVLRLDDGELGVTGGGAVV
jgi:hypothetical protein